MMYVCVRDVIDVVFSVCIVTRGARVWEVWVFCHEEVVCFCLVCNLWHKKTVAVHLALWYVVLVCHQYDVCENSVGSVYVGGYGGLSESRLCVFCKSCPVCFLVVGKGPSVLL